MTWPNGDKYDGEWFNDCINGKGTMTWENGDKYTGEWLNEMRNGFGIMESGDENEKETYEGQWI